jgi:peptidoglycan/xylan/chitin deacetylase (PgdA/CDA1 family)
MKKLTKSTTSWHSKISGKADVKAIKRKIRNLFGGGLGIGLILFGCVHRARKKTLSGQYVTPICFHNPNEKLFRKCIKWLGKNGYVFISSQQLIDIIKKRSPPPPGAVWISFDDGWKKNVNSVIPAVIELNVPVTFFISTNEIENGVFWWSLVYKYRKFLPDEYKNNINELWCIEEHKRKQIIENVNNKVANSNRHREAMTIQDIKFLSNLPQVTIGSHTVHHVITPNCTDRELEFEVRNSKNILETWTGKEIHLFSYPNGDFDGREKKVLKKYGYKLAATIENKLISTNDDLYFIPRFTVMDDGFFSENLCHMLGIWQPFVSIVKKILLRHFRRRTGQTPYLYRKYR